MSRLSGQKPQNGTIHIEASVEVIESRCFQRFMSLKEVIFTNDSKLRHTSENAFSQSDLVKITIPSEVETLDYFCVYRCTSLEEAIFSNDSKLHHIEIWAFYGSSLEKITIPSQVEFISECDVEYLEICKNNDRFVLDCNCVYDQIVATF